MGKPLGRKNRMHHTFCCTWVESSLLAPGVAALLDPGVLPGRAVASIDDDSIPVPTKPAEVLGEGVALKDSRMNLAMSGRPKLSLTSWAMGGGKSPCSPHPELSSWGGGAYEGYQREWGRKREAVPFWILECVVERTCVVCGNSE